MKHFDCGTLVPGCHWHIDGKESAEVVRRAVEHLRTIHGESEVRPEMVERIKARLIDDEAAVRH